jgi:hypothetical protein
MLLGFYLGACHEILAANGVFGWHELTTTSLGIPISVFSCVLVHRQQDCQIFQLIELSQGSPYFRFLSIFFSFLHTFSNSCAERSSVLVDHDGDTVQARASCKSEP